MKRLSNRGFTLVEIIVSVAILYVVCVLFVMVVNGAFGLYSRGADLERQGSEAASIMENIDNGSVTPTEEEEGELDFAGNSVNGTYKTVTVGDTSFKIFVAAEEQ
ncbi:MAG: prepilin-type N-terminal cleavage/methylation domain-containing protein [Bacillota bacterium]|nr:prepilin-type N-terminal cleavage/methylation domain-containing protein [Bacillota bacterium]